MLSVYPKTQISKSIVEESIFHYMKFMASLPGVELHEEADVFCLCADTPVLYLNSVFDAHFHANARQKIESAREFFHGRGDSFTWFVTPSSEPEKLGELILAHGGEFLKTVPHMAIHLDELQRDFPFPSNFDCKPVRTHDQLAIWTSIYCHARGSQASIHKLFSIFADLDLTETAPLQLILGYLSDQPVATYSVFMDAETEIAGFYSLSTLPEMRGQGLGTAISVVAADLALEYGYKTALLISDPPSRNICKRIGFEEGYGNMDIYRLPA